MAGRGIDCAVVQTVLRYNTLQDRANNGFRLTANNSNSSGPETCAAVTRTRVIMGMVVVEVELLTVQSG